MPAKSLTSPPRPQVCPDLNILTFCIVTETLHGHSHPEVARETRRCNEFTADVGQVACRTWCEDNLTNHRMEIKVSSTPSPALRKA